MEHSQLPARRGRFRLPDSAPTALLAPLVIGALLAAYLILNGGGWAFDDNLILGLARSYGVTLSWLHREIFQHWDPAMNLTYSAMVHVFPVDYRWGLLLLLLLLGASMVVFYVVLGSFARSRWGRLAATGWFGFSIIWVSPLQWWAYGIQALPTVLCDLLCLLGMLRFRTDPRARWLILSAGAMAVGLGFYEKPALMPLYLLLIATLLLPRGGPGAELRTTLVRERRLWLAYVVILAVWGIGYVSSHALGGAGSSAAPPLQLLHFLWIMWGHTLLPALVGISIPYGHLNAAQIVAIVGMEALVTAALVVSLRRNRLAWRAWLFVGLVVVLNAAPVAWSRVGDFGVGIGADPRYLSDFTWLIPIALCAAFGGFGARARIPVVRGMTRFAAPALAAGLLALYVAGSVVTAHHLQARWPGPAARGWETAVQRSYARLSLPPVRSDGRPVVADARLPFFIISPTFAPVDRLDWVLPLYLKGIQVDGSLTGPLLRVDTAGNVRRARLRAVAGGPVALLLRRHVVNAAANVVARHGQLCVTGNRKDTRIQVSFPADATPERPLYLLLDYASDRPATIQVRDGAGPRLSLQTRSQVSLARDSHLGLVLLDSALPRQVRMTVFRPGHPCLRSIRLAVVRDAATPQ